MNKIFLSLTAVSVIWAGPSLAGAAPIPACAAVVQPSVRGVDGDATAMAQSLRDLFVTYLTGPSLKSLPLEARLPAQAVEEARQKDCGYVLIATLTRKRSGGGAFGKALGQAAGNAAWHLPYGGTAASAAARTAAIAGAYAVSGVAQSTRAKDELTLEYRIAAPDAVEQAHVRREILKATSDGEDLVTPLVERVAATVAGLVAK
ncbi:MAG TPA: hypothetical protein VI485_30890 [Vicinamibacterales bacterium]|nr:hypothetical protein [Vicinamibacterales bacterium]